MNLVEALCPEAQEDLARHGIVELVSISVMAVPDPARPEDRLALKITVEVNDNFQNGIPAVDRDLDMADEICTSAVDDLSLSLRDELLVTLDTRRREIAELREGKVDGQPAVYLSDPEIASLIRPTLENPVIDALIWSIGWCATKEDDGKILVYCDTPLMSEDVDEDSWVRIQDRIRQVNYIIGGLMAGLLGEG